MSIFSEARFVYTCSEVAPTEDVIHVDRLRYSALLEVIDKS